MNELSERRLAENEVEFRHVNIKNKVRRQEEGSARDLLFDCYCECSNRHCHERIRITIDDYEKIHEDNRQFIALAGHENKAIEQVIGQMEGYNVIQKYTDPSEVIAEHV